MKKSLLIMAAAMFVAIGANAQKVLSKSNIAGIKFDKTAVMEASKFDGSHKQVTKQTPKKASAIGTIFGSRVATQLAPDEETYEAFKFTLEEANVQDDKGNTYNVKINDFGIEGTTCYGIYNETDGTLRIPNQIIYDNVSLVGLGYSEATATYGPLEIVNIDSEDLVSEEDIVFVEEDGIFTFAEENTSAYYIYADGLDSGWTYAFDVAFGPSNGEVSYYTTSTRFITEPGTSAWGYGEEEITYEDWGTSVQINGFLGTGVISIGKNGDGTVTMMMGQRLSGDNYGDPYGYMHLVADALDEEAGTISVDTSIESIDGEIFEDVTVDGRPADVIRFFGVEDGKITWEQYLCPGTNTDEDDRWYTLGGHFCDFQFILYKDGGTGINNVKADTANKTVKTYNLMGQEVNANTKGLIIRDGKKFVNK